jgi:putative Mg2+ transporter-C (MgtC) family protein
MDPLSWDFWLPLGMAVLCGAIVGAEREANDKPAGLRTCIFVCLGSMLFIRLGLLAGNKSGDPTRVLGQVITGVGFIGAGVILGRGGAVHGVTTAAVIWLLAAVGAMIGFGHADAALAVSLVAVALLIGLERIGRQVPKGAIEDEPPRL